MKITLEANPDDLDKKLSERFIQNRNQSTFHWYAVFQEDLKLMNRAHNASEAESSIKRAQDFGFKNLSIDLIYGS